MEYQCGSWAAGRTARIQSPECARYVRVRISQLRRMAECAYLKWMDSSSKRSFRLWDLSEDCLREIDRLRGGA
jgi:hypothetical protein